MIRNFPNLLVPLIFFFIPFSAFSEYRAYELEVFDHITNSSRKIITSFSPSDFIQVNGGPQRIGIIIRASWICYGDTSCKITFNDNLRDIKKMMYEHVCVCIE